jgi:lysophospholipase L1-like esterase
MKSLLIAGSLLIVPSFSPERTEPVAFRIKQDYGVVNQEADTITGGSYLDEFFGKLEKLRREKNQVISVMHIGDSHVQADWMTGRMRKSFQYYFGHAGRGLIIPARVAKSNEAASIFSSSSGTWEVKKIISSDQSIPSGVGGITFHTSDSTAGLSIDLKDSADFSYRNTKLSVLYRKDSSGYFIELKDRSKRTMGWIGSYTKEDDSELSTIFPAGVISGLTLQIKKTQPFQKQFTLYGLILENGQPGMLYHTVGVNGAKFKHFAAATELHRQSRKLNPDLVIISLGTNDAGEFPSQDAGRINHIINLIEGIRKFNPQASFLLTTVPGHFRNGNKKHPGIELVNTAIQNIASAQHIPVFDLYEAGGGKNFASRWAKRDLIQPDGIHFTKEGYELQGEMLFQAIITSFNRYATH